MLLERLSEPGNADVKRTLAGRGLDKAERQRLGALLPLAQGTVEAPSAGRETEPREAERRAVYRWFRDWSVTAHAVVRRKQHLIALGLASRRRSGQGEESSPGGIARAGDEERAVA